MTGDIAWQHINSKGIAREGGGGVSLYLRQSQLVIGGYEQSLARSLWTITSSSRIKSAINDLLVKECGSCYK